MAKTVMFFRGSLGVTGGHEMNVIRNPSPESSGSRQDNPSVVSDDNMMVQEPGSSGMISLKVLRERISKGGR